MLFGRIDGATRTIGESQGYEGLAIRDDLIECPVNGPGTAMMTTAWIPTPQELEALNAGAPCPDPRPTAPAYPGAGRTDAAGGGLGHG